jgi:RNA polymerase sigma factor (sigma-70 family)
MNSFFVRNAEDGFALNDWNELWSLLVTITLRKCGKQVDYYHAAKRDVRTEVARNDDSLEAWEAIARDPSPMEALLLSELVERIMSQLEPRQKQILDCCLQGMNVEQIRQQVGCSERTVFRTLERVSKQLCTHATA